MPRGLCKVTEEVLGYRRGVGLIVCNGQGEVLWARRVGGDGWQFPQGGVEVGESEEEAAYRELWEEVGLEKRDVRLLGVTEGRFRYDIPEARRVRGFRGQEQRWFLFGLVGAESRIRLDVGGSAEFDGWRWVGYWEAVERVVEFKRGVYREVLGELEGLVGGFIEGG